MRVYEAGLSDGQIGAQLGYTAQAIYAWRKKNGLAAHKVRRVRGGSRVD